MKYLVSANFNLMHTNMIWKNLKDKNLYDFDDFNNLNFSMNNKHILEKYDKFYFILYVNDFIKEKNHLKKVINNIKKISKIYNSKYFFVLFLNDKETNSLQEQKNTLVFYNSFQNFKTQIPNLKFVQVPTSKKDFNLRNYYFLKFPLEIKSLNLIIREMNKTNLKISSPFKLIILDCDNTLWGGVAGEDGIKSIKYGEDGEGKIYEDIHKQLKFLKSCGILLSISSKNDENTVWNSLKKRNMILKRKDFILPKINWRPKEENIKEVLNILSLRSQDVIFIDDSEIEIRKVKNTIKNINIYKVSDLIDFINFLKNNNRLNINTILIEDKKKKVQYEIRNKYVELREKVKNDNVFSNLNQKVFFENITQKNFARTLQLFNKTNQFNFTTNRYQANDLDKILKDKNKKIQLVAFADKFGNHGIIGVYVIKIGPQKITIEDFALSCRVINRKIEEYILLNILKKYSKNINIFINFKQNKNNKNLINNFLRNTFFSTFKKTNKLKIYKIILNNDLKNVQKFFKK